MNTSAETDMQPTEEENRNVESVETVKKPEAETDKAPTSASTKKPNKKQKKRKERAKKGNQSLKQVSARFAACGRCSFFWAGYKVIFGESGQETAVNESQSGWLNLEWNAQMHNLLYKSYGIRLDVNFYHYEGCCKECRRRFSYRAADEVDEPSHCAIEISPHNAI